MDLLSQENTCIWTFAAAAEIHEQPPKFPVSRPCIRNFKNFRNDNVDTFYDIEMRCGEMILSQLKNFVISLVYCRAYTTNSSASPMLKINDTATIVFRSQCSLHHNLVNNCDNCDAVVVNTCRSDNQLLILQGAFEHNMLQVN